MAEISDGVFAQVSGTVGRTGQAKNGPYAVVEVLRDGNKFPDRVTVWGLDAVSGDRVAVKGWLSWRRSERDEKVFFDVSLNQPQIVSHEHVEAPAGDVWASEAPF